MMFLQYWQSEDVYSEKTRILGDQNLRPQVQELQDQPKLGRRGSPSE